MVFAFICHSVASAPCRVLYSAVYGNDLSPETGRGVPQRTTRKEQLLQVSCRVQSEYGFKIASKDRVQRSHDDISANDSGHRLTPEKGYFRLYPGDPFPSAKVVIWSVVEECAYVMVCEQDENRLLAEMVLAVISRLIREHVTSLEQKNAEILLKAEKTATILHHFLPCGQLIFMNHKLIAQYERQLETTLNTK